MRKTILRTVLLASIVLAAMAWHSAPANGVGMVKIQRTLMGTIWEIEVCDNASPESARRAIEDAYAELNHIDQLMSEWKPASAVSQINAAAGKNPIAIPEELRDLLRRSIQYSRETEGTFDITWRGMGRIWRFDEGFQVPSKEAVETARRRIDYRKIMLTEDRAGLPEGMNIGLGGIAKGYAVDRAMQVIADKGFTNAMVNGGGDIVTRGTRLGQPWRLGIQHPRREHGELLGAVALRDRALITSGDYERFRMVNGVRYHHIIDPRTGWPATASSSVTVLSPNAELGVVFAKAIFILGPEKGLALAKAKGIEALLITPDGSMHKTSGFPALQ